MRGQIGGAAMGPLVVSACTGDSVCCSLLGAVVYISLYAVMSYGWALGYGPAWIHKEHLGKRSKKKKDVGAGTGKNMGAWLHSAR